MSRAIFENPDLPQVAIQPIHIISITALYIISMEFLQN